MKRTRMFKSAGGCSLVCVAAAILALLLAHGRSLAAAAQVPEGAIDFVLPEDSYVSLVIQSRNGQVVRRLLDGERMAAGKHRVVWDGDTEGSAGQPGDVAPPGQYTWQLLYQPGLRLSLNGWACNSGRVPWKNGAASDWGGDDGVPSAVATDGDRAYMGWSGARSGALLVAADFAGRPIWRWGQGQANGIQALAVDQGTLFVLMNGIVRRLVAATGVDSPWDGRDSAELPVSTLWPDPVGHTAAPNGMDAHGGRLYLCFEKESRVMVVGEKSGTNPVILTVLAPRCIRAIGPVTAYVVSAGKSVEWLNVATGATRTVVQGLAGVTAMDVDADGDIYLGFDDPVSQVKVYSPNGALLRTIGRPGGRPAPGPWQAGGMRGISGLSVDVGNRLWVAEGDPFPPRFSSWDATTGTLIRDFFGPAQDGGAGAAIDPLDPGLIAGGGCEWRIDPDTGRADCQGVIERAPADAARYVRGLDGDIYLITASGDAKHRAYHIFECVGVGSYKIRAALEDNPDAGTTTVWSDENADELRQPGEVSTLPGLFDASSADGASIYVGADLSFYGTSTQLGMVRLKPSGYTPAGAPRYDAAHVVKIPAVGLPSPDGRLLLGTEPDGSLMAYNAGAGDAVWGAPMPLPAEPSVVKPLLAVPSPAILGSATLPAPVGEVWAVRDGDRWDLINEDAQVVGKLFHAADARAWWPDKAAPGADMSGAAPGSPPECRGGLLCQSPDGKVYVEAGKTAYWELQVTGLDAIHSIQGQVIAPRP